MALTFKGYYLIGIDMVSTDTDNERGLRRITINTYGGHTDVFASDGSTHDTETTLIGD